MCAVGSTIAWARRVPPTESTVQIAQSGPAVDKRGYTHKPRETLALSRDTESPRAGAGQSGGGVLDVERTEATAVMEERERVDASELMKPGGLLHRLLEDGIKPHAAELTQIAMRGEVAVIVFEQDETVLTALEAMGWNGRTVFGITRSRGERFAKASNDPVWQAWAARPSNMTCLRIFVCIHMGTLLVNYRPDKGYDLEPGQSDPQVLN
jgi:hypothetical protein